MSRVPKWGLLNWQRILSYLLKRIVAQRHADWLLSGGLMLILNWKPCKPSWDTITADGRQSCKKSCPIRQIYSMSHFNGYIWIEEPIIFLAEQDEESLKCSPRLSSYPCAHHRRMVIEWNTDELDLVALNRTQKAKKKNHIRILEVFEWDALLILSR